MVEMICKCNHLEKDHKPTKFGFCASCYLNINLFDGYTTLSAAHHFKADNLKTLENAYEHKTR